VVAPREIAFIARARLAGGLSLRDRASYVASTAGRVLRCVRVWDGGVPQARADTTPGLVLGRFAHVGKLP